MTWKDCTIFSSDWCLSWNHFSQKVSVSWLVNFIRRIYFWKYWLEKGILCSFLMWIIFKLKLYFPESLVLMACEFHQMNIFLIILAFYCFRMWILFELKSQFLESLILMACEFHQIEIFLPILAWKEFWAVFECESSFGEIIFLKKSHSHGLWISSDWNIFGNIGLQGILCCF